MRHVDYTGVSGIGIVAYGVAFADGQIVLRWCSTHPATSLWSSIDDLLAVHGHGEATSIEWIDAPHGEMGDVPPPQRAGRRAKRRAEETEEEPVGSNDAAPTPAPAAPEADTSEHPAAAPAAEPPAPAPPEPQPATGADEPLAPLPRRPVRVVTRGERDPVNGRLSTDTAPLLFDPFGTERDRPTPEPARPPPEPAQRASEAPRRPGRHRRPDPSNNSR